MTEGEWKEKFKRRFMSYMASWPEAEKQKWAQEIADISYPDYKNEDPEECATAEAEYMQET